MTDSPSAEDLVALQDTLYDSRNPTRRWLHRSRRAYIEEAIEAAGPGQSALEVGPGSGVYLPALQRSFDEVTAADIERAHLDHLIPRFPSIHFIGDDITRSSLDAERFDLVLCSEVVEHVPDSLAALRGIHRVMKPGGTLILSTPQRYSPLELASKVAFLPGALHVVRWIYREPILKQGHINLMTRRTVRNQLKRAGFRIEREHLSGVYIPLLAEFGGRLGRRVAEGMEGILRAGPLTWTLWTQYYVATKSDPS